MYLLFCTYIIIENDNVGDIVRDAGNNDVNENETVSLHNLSNITDILGQNEIDINSPEAVDHCLNHNVSNFSGALSEATSTLIIVLLHPLPLLVLLLNMPHRPEI